MDQKLKKLLLLSLFFFIIVSLNQILTFKTDNISKNKIIDRKHYNIDTALVYDNANGTDVLITGIIGKNIFIYDAQNFTIANATIIGNIFIYNCSEVMFDDVEIDENFNLKIYNSSKIIANGLSLYSDAYFYHNSNLTLKNSTSTATLVFGNYSGVNENITVNIENCYLKSSRFYGKSSVSINSSLISADLVGYENSSHIRLAHRPFPLRQKTLRGIRGLSSRSALGFSDHHS